MSNSRALARATTAQRRYWERIARFGCIAALQDAGSFTCASLAEIAHAHDGSIVERMQEEKAKGVILQRYNWLVLPLCPIHHRLGERGQALDLDVAAWEARYGPQAGYIDWLIHRTGVDVWTLAREEPVSRYKRPAKVLPRPWA